jgi:hypothetical protein
MQIGHVGDPERFLQIRLYGMTANLNPNRLNPVSIGKKK